ncbi:hypothetical protein FIBSPDRAFT_858722 [Athelia psychrophila]|uniref:Uncharacterized protein n=1 Tax=Athelia psychrophila TaxID=1759441 RepID=A0A166LP19_9AGAM|nr:hypothetical protein FIBSPDRAFT_858722 [Fibularhizoctonia sp. CBS 109695]
MDRRDFNSPAAAASLAAQGVGTIFGAAYWTGFYSEPPNFNTQQDQTPQPPTRLQDFLSPRLPYTHAFEQDSCGEENAGGPITEE